MKIPLEILKVMYENLPDGGRREQIEPFLRCITDSNGILSIYNSGDRRWIYVKYIELLSIFTLEQGLKKRSLFRKWKEHLNE